MARGQKLEDAAWLGANLSREFKLQRRKWGHGKVADWVAGDGGAAREVYGLGFGDSGAGLNYSGMGRTRVRRQW